MSQSRGTQWVRRGMVLASGVVLLMVASPRGGAADEEASGVAAADVVAGDAADCSPSSSESGGTHAGVAGATGVKKYYIMQFYNEWKEMKKYGATQKRRQESSKESYKQFSGMMKGINQGVPNLMQGIVGIARSGGDGWTVARGVLNLAAQVSNAVSEGGAEAKNPAGVVTAIVAGSIGALAEIASGMIEIFVYQPTPWSEIEQFQKTFIVETKEGRLQQLQLQQKPYVDFIDNLGTDYQAMVDKIKDEIKTMEEEVAKPQKDVKEKNLTGAAERARKAVNAFADNVVTKDKGVWGMIRGLSNSMGGVDNSLSTLKLYGEIIGEKVGRRDVNNLENGYRGLENYFSYLCGLQVEGLKYYWEYVYSDKFMIDGRVPTQAEREKEIDSKFQEFIGLMKKQAGYFMAAVDVLATKALEQQDPDKGRKPAMYFAADQDNLNSLAYRFLSSFFMPLEGMTKEDGTPEVNPYKITKIYVTPDGAGSKNGTSWSDAYGDLESAMKDVPQGKFTEIWVSGKSGWYYEPSVQRGFNGDATTDRHRSFQMRNGCAIYGGFKGDEEEFDQRDVQKYPTILGAKPGDINSEGTNLLHVIMNHVHHANLITNTSDTNELKLGTSAILDGVIIEGGWARGEGGKHNMGGGVLNGYGSAPVFANCVFRNNVSADAGGSVVNFNASPTFENCVFLGVADSVRPYQRGFGGAVAQWKLDEYIAPMASFHGCAFTDNYSDLEGGALAVADNMSVAVSNCTFDSNKTAWKGGAIRVGAKADVIVTSTLFRNNWAGQFGGALFGWNSSRIRLVNSTFYGNTARDACAGACYIFCNDKDYPTQVVNCTFLENSSGQPQWGNTLYFEGDHVSLHNNLIWEKAAPVKGHYALCINGKAKEAKWNIFRSCNKKLSKSVNKTDDPELGDLGWNGGLTMTCPISAGSKANNFGTVNVDDKEINELIKYDARGRQRVAVEKGKSHSKVDAGAFNYAKPADFRVVAPPSDDPMADFTGATSEGGGATWQDTCTLDQALLLATSGDKIWVRKGVYVPRNSYDWNTVVGQFTPSIFQGGRNRSFVIPAGVELYGGFTGGEKTQDERKKNAALSVLDGNIDGTAYAQLDPCMDTDTSRNAYHVVMLYENTILDGFTVANGNTDGAEESLQKGAGVWTRGGTTTVNQCAIVHNYGKYFPGVHNSSSVTNCLISNNTGGGNDAGVVGAGIIQNCTITNNLGNGIGSYEPRFVSNVKGCTITANSGYGIAGTGDSPVSCSLSAFYENTKGNFSFECEKTHCHFEGDPGLADVAFNGGFTPTRALKNGSPCRMAVDYFEGRPDCDQRGVARPKSGKIDIGAFQSVGEIKLTLTADAQRGMLGVPSGGEVGTYSVDIPDGSFDCDTTRVTAKPKEMREFIMWRYLVGGKPGAEYSRDATLKMDRQPEVTGGAVVLEALFSVPHYAVTCEINQDGKGEISGVQPPTWKDLNAEGGSQITCDIPKSTKDSVNGKTVEFTMIMNGKLKLDFTGVDGNKLTALTLDGEKVTPKETGKTGNTWSYDLGEVTSAHTVKAQFSKGATRTNDTSVLVAEEGARSGQNSSGQATDGRTDSGDSVAELAKARLQISVDDFRPAVDKAVVRHVELPAGFSLSEEQRKSLEVRVDDYSFQLGALNGVWSGSLDAVYVTVEGAKPSLKLRLDFANMTCDIEASRFTSEGRIGLHNGAVPLMFVNEGEILFTASVKDVSVKSIWSYSPQIEAAASISSGSGAGERAGFGFLASGSHIAGSYRGDGSGGESVVMAKRMAMALPQDVDLFGSDIALCLDDLRVPLTLEPTGEPGVFLARWSGTVAGCVQMDIGRDSCDFIIRNSASPLLDLSDGFDVSLEVGDHVGTQRIYPKRKMMLSR